MKHVGYSYEASEHCIDCAMKHFGVITETTCDREGNPVHALFSGDETDDRRNCDGCGAYIPSVYKSCVEPIIVLGA